eukprot:scaffold869_cov105-Isochrysis_galbana.AAC.30
MSCVPVRLPTCRVLWAWFVRKFRSANVPPRAPPPVPQWDIVKNVRKMSRCPGLVRKYRVRNGKAPGIALELECPHGTHGSCHHAHSDKHERSSCTLHAQAPNGHGHGHGQLPESDFM